MSEKISSDDVMKNNMSYDEWKSGKTAPSETDYSNSGNQTEKKEDQTLAKKEAKSYDPANLNKGSYPGGYIPCAKAKFSTGNCPVSNDEQCKECQYYKEI